ncbi:hypothetical protein ITH51_06575 [Salmonella enterica subsp. enterica serovar Weltevreden]
MKSMNIAASGELIPRLSTHRNVVALDSTDFTDVAAVVMDLTLYIQTFLLSYDCDNFLRIYSRGERYPSALCG